MKETYFASPEKSSSAELKNEISVTGCSEIIDGLLTMTNGALAVLNQNRVREITPGRILSILFVTNDRSGNSLDRLLYFHQTFLRICAVINVIYIDNINALRNAAYVDHHRVIFAVNKHILSSKYLSSR